eukprot:scaffold26432_cov33-Tisochrysis_lutea.AAC.4
MCALCSLSSCQTLLQSMQHRCSTTATWARGILRSSCLVRLRQARPARPSTSWSRMPVPEAGSPRARRPRPRCALSPISTSPSRQRARASVHRFALLDA